MRDVPALLSEQLAGAVGLAAEDDEAARGSDLNVGQVVQSRRELPAGRGPSAVAMSEHLTDEEKQLRREQIRSASTRMPGNRALRRLAAKRLIKQQRLGEAGEKR